MRKRKDITGQAFGHLTALYDTGRSDTIGSAIWRFRCSCGQEIDRSLQIVRYKKNQSCGCQEEELRKHKGKDITGQTFGFLTALYNTGRIDKYGYSIWMLRCICGKEVERSTREVCRSKYISCGCQGRRGHPRKDITGRTIGNLTALYYTGRSSKDNGSAIWRFKCLCGNEIDRSIQNIERVKWLSCGCKSRKTV